MNRRPGGTPHHGHSGDTISTGRETRWRQGRGLRWCIDRGRVHCEAMTGDAMDLRNDLARVGGCPARLSDLSVPYKLKIAHRP